MKNRKITKFFAATMTILMILSVVSVASAAGSHSHGSGSYTVSAYDQLGKYRIFACTGVTQAGVTDAITSSDHCGNTLAHGGVQCKATAVSGSRTDRVRLESLRIDPNYTSNWVGASYNTSSRYVQLVQYYLAYNMYPINVIDGKWGPNTLDCIKKFQSKNALSADGVLGTSSWKVFCSYVTSWR